MIFSTGQVVYCLCYSLFLNSNNDIFQKFMANFSEVSYLALNIFSAIKASQFNFSENLTFKKHCFAQSSTELLSYQVSRQQHHILDKLKKNNCGSFLCKIPLFLWHLPRCHDSFHDSWADEEPSVVTGLQQSAPLYNICIFWHPIRREVCIFWHPIRREVSLSETFRVYISVKIYSGDKTGCTRTIFLSVSFHLLFHLKGQNVLATGTDWSVWKQVQ